MDKDNLFKVLFEQQKDFRRISNLVNRDSVKKVRDLIKLKMPLIITGVRRCGKSSLLKLISEDLKLNENDFLYLNFNDERFVNFEISNFQDILDYLIKEKYIKNCYLFFDEIQEVQGWEKWINRIKGSFKIIITGSNSKLLSSEISSILTGRSLSLSLFPFSFSEYLNFKKVDIKKYKLDREIELKIKQEFENYFEIGGFPKMILERNRILLMELYENILYRDIISRFKGNLIKSIKEISLYLQSNVSSDISLRTLSKISGIKNLETLKNILNSFEQSFLFFFTNKFNYSVKKQIQNPKKIYCIDNGLSNVLGFKFSKDSGNLLENLVAIELKRRGKETFYFQKKGECDFVLREGAKIKEVIQVCYKLTEKNKDREIKGLLEAMDEFKLKEGLILTYDDEKGFNVGGKKIKVLPVWKWLLGS